MPHSRATGRCAHWRRTGGSALGLVLIAVACHDRAASPVTPPVAPADRTASLSATSVTNQTGTVGAEVASRPTVIARDALGNPVGGVPIVFAGVTTATISTTSDGQASTPWVLPIRPGAYTLDASAGGLPAVQFRAVAVVGLPASITEATPLDRTLLTGAAAAESAAVIVADYVGNPLAGVVVAFTLGGSGGTIEHMSAVTDAGGRATPGTWNVGPDVGVYSLTARVAGVASPLIFTAHVYPPFVASSIAAGAYASCANALNGATYCWGNRAPIPTPVQGGERFASLTVGGGFACGLTMDGAAYCWGRDFTNVATAGTLPPPASFAAPRRVGGGIVFSLIVAGDTFACGLGTDRRAYCWGDNAFGQVGDGTTVVRALPTLVSGEHAFTTLAAGLAHACGLTSDGEAYCWGANEARQLGDFSTQTCDTLEFDYYTNVYFAVHTSCSSTPQRVRAAPAFVAVSAGEGTCGLGGDGTAYCWGYSSSAEPISGSVRFSNIVAMAFYDRARPNVITTMCGTTQTGALFCRRSDALEPAAIAPGLAFTSVAPGTEHQCGIARGSGQVYCWGENRDGQLGNGSGAASTAPIPVLKPDP